MRTKTMAFNHPIKDPASIDDLQSFLESEIVPGGRKIKAILSFVPGQAPSSRAEFIRCCLETAQTRGRNFSFQSGRNEEHSLTWFCGEGGHYIISYDGGTVRVSTGANIGSLTDAMLRASSMWETLAD